MTSFPVKSLEELSIAERDKIGETNANIPLTRKQVKEIIMEKYPELELPSDQDNMLDCCLRVRKFDVQSAATQAHLLFKFLSDFYKMHNEISYYMPSTHHKTFYEQQGYVVLKQRDHLGRAVMIVNYDKIPVQTFNIDQAAAAAIMMVAEMIRCSVDTQRLGIVFVFDMGGFQFGHARQFSVSRIRIIARMLQGSFPLRIKGMHIVRCPQIFSMTYSMIRPFLKEKMKNRIHFYGSDLTKFLEHLSPDILPNFLGGNVSNDEFADVEFSKRLVTMDEYYYEQSVQSGYIRNGNIKG